MIELTVILKDEEKTCKQKFLVYEDLNVCTENEVIQQFIKECRQSFNGEPESIQIKISMIVL